MGYVADEGSACAAAAAAAVLLAAESFAAEA